MFRPHKLSLCEVWGGTLGATGSRMLGPTVKSSPAPPSYRLRPGVGARPACHSDGKTTSGTTQALSSIHPVDAAPCRLPRHSARRVRSPADATVEVLAVAEHRYPALPGAAPAGRSRKPAPFSDSGSQALAGNQVVHASGRLRRERRSPRRSAGLAKKSTTSYRAGCSSCCSAATPPDSRAAKRLLLHALSRTTTDTHLLFS